MSDNINKITRVIIKPAKNCVLKIHIKLVNKRMDGKTENFQNVYINGNDEGTLALDFQSLITLELKDGEWEREKTICITQNNIYQLIKGMERVINKFYNEKIFAVKKGTNEIVMYKDKAQECTERIYNLGMNQRMIIQPSIIYDNNDLSYEGVVMYLNKTANFIELPIDAFESLYYALKQINIFEYSQSLLNYYISSVKNEKVELTQVQLGGGQSKKKKHPLEITSEEKEETTSTLKTKQTAEEFFGINNKKGENENE